MNKPTEEQIENVLSGRASSEEAMKVARWFATDEGKAFLSTDFDRMVSSVKSGEELYISQEIRSDKMLDAVFRRIRRKQMRKVIFRVAAVLLPLIFLLGLFFQLNSRVDLFGNSGYEEVYVPRGERLQMMFQDGTKVCLNSDTYLRYPKKFGYAERKVFLKGEAYFFIAPSKRRLSVFLDGLSVQVKGTAFDVRAYPEEREISVCLDEGEVCMSLHSSHKEILLNPGERMVYHKESGKYSLTRNVDTAFSSLWKQNIVAFKDTPLPEVLVLLGRWYDVEFEMDNVNDDLFVTLTSERATLEEILQDLEKITPLAFDYEKGKGLVRIHADMRE